MNPPDGWFLRVVPFLVPCLSPDAQWPWGKIKGILFWLVDFKGNPLPPKKQRKQGAPLGNWVSQAMAPPGRTLPTSARTASGRSPGFSGSWKYTRHSWERVLESRSNSRG